MKLRECIADLQSKISALTPKTWQDVSFSFPKGDLEQSVEYWMNDSGKRHTREAVVSLVTLPSTDDSYCVARAEYEITIFYGSDVPTDELINMMSEDVISIQRGVGMNPFIDSSISSLSFLSRLPSYEMVGFGNLLHIPFEIIFNVSDF